MNKMLMEAVAAKYAKGTFFAYETINKTDPKAYVQTEDIVNLEFNLKKTNLITLHVDVMPDDVNVSTATVNVPYDTLMLNNSNQDIIKLLNACCEVKNELYIVKMSFSNLGASAELNLEKTTEINIIAVTPSLDPLKNLLAFYGTDLGYGENWISKDIKISETEIADNGMDKTIGVGHHVFRYYNNDENDEINLGFFTIYEVGKFTGTEIPHKFIILIDKEYTTNPYYNKKEQPC